MKGLTIKQQMYADISEVFQWAFNEHYALWVTGKAERHKPTDTALRALVKKGKLVTARYGKKLIYSTPERLRLYVSPNNDFTHADIHLPHHGLGCTEALVRLMLSMKGEAVSEKTLKAMKLGIVPDFGIIENTVLFGEFQSKGSAYHRGKLRKKIASYMDSSIEQVFDKSFIVLFIYDMPVEFVRSLVTERTPSNFFFVDYDTFRSIPYGEQLDAPIYIWGYDGTTHTLKKDT